MPARGWFDAAMGQGRPFGTEWEWTDPPVDPGLMVDIAQKTVAAAARHDYGMRLSPSRLSSLPRAVFIEKFVDYLLDPEDAAGMQIGAIIHAAVERPYQGRGYDTETLLEGRLFGYDLVGIPDIQWPEPATLPETLPHIIEIKSTAPGGMKFIVEAAAPRPDHRLQTRMYAHLYAQRHGMRPEDVRTAVSYFTIPQKERSMGQWIRVPASVWYTAHHLTEDEIADAVPGYSLPNRASDYQGPMPPTVRARAGILMDGFARITAGETAQAVVADLDCMCDRVYNGQGRNYCRVMRDCAMLHHGTPMW